MNPLSPPPKILLWGAGSQARIITEMLLESGLSSPVILFDETLTKPDFVHTGDFINDPVRLKKCLHKVSHFITCIGNEHGYARVMTSNCLQSLGLLPLSIIHQTSFIENTSQVGYASLVMPRAIVHKFSEIGSHSILNTGSIVEHECLIGDGVHIMAGSIICGKVRIENYATIGTNATVLPHIKIGEGAFVGAGALVDKDVPPYAVVRGVPANIFRQNTLCFHHQTLNYLSNTSSD